MKLFQTRLFSPCIFCAYWRVSIYALAQEKIEVVLLIDVSGRTRPNDPRSLHAPATRLLINLLKNKVLLTVFTFATTTELLVIPINLNTEIHLSSKDTEITSAEERSSKPFINLFFANGLMLLIVLSMIAGFFYKKISTFLKENGYARR